MDTYYPFQSDNSLNNGSFGAMNRSMNQSGSMYTGVDQYYTQSSPIDKLVSLYKEILNGQGRYPANEIVHKSLLNPEIDLFCIPDPLTATQGIAPILHNALGGNGPILDAAWSDSRLASFLFSSLRIHSDRSNGPRDGLLSRCVTEWIDKLLPLQQSRELTSFVQSTLHSPLELFLPECSFLLSVPSEGDDTVAVRGAHLASQLIISLCDSEQFPSINRIFLLRQILRQLHQFCLSEGTDPQLTSLKRALHLRSPFMNDLYSFFYSSIDQCPSIHIFKDIFSLWLTFVRPWRYSPLCPRSSSPSSSPLSTPSSSSSRTGTIDYSQYYPFIRTHHKFYSVLLGKILKKLRQLEISLDTVKVLKTAIECSFRPGIAHALEYLDIDSKPSLKVLLDGISVQLRRPPSPQPDEYDSYMSSTYSSSATQLKEELRSIVRDAESLFNYVPPSIPIHDNDGVISSSPSSSSPRRRRLSSEDYYIDSKTGLMMLTPTGRKHVYSGSRSFDFTPSCQLSHQGYISRILSSSLISPYIQSIMNTSSTAPHAVPLFSRFVPHFQSAIKSEAIQSAFIISLSFILSILIHPILFILVLIYLYYLYTQTTRD